MIISFLSACHYWLLRDLINQIRQIKFKNGQLTEINERLQYQLELTEENIRSINSKYMDLEKKQKHLANVSEENKQLIIEIDDIRKYMESEQELKRRIQCEKIMIESELSAAKEYIQSLMEKLTALDVSLEEKDRIINSLKSMIAQQEEFFIKLQDINSEKDIELQKNQKEIRELTDAIFEYEEKINVIEKQKDDIEKNMKPIRLPKTTEHEKPNISQDSACGGDNDHHNMCTTQSEFIPNYSNRSIKLELATELIDSPGDSPLCEKLYLEDDVFSESSDESSYQMLNSLLSMFSSLRMTLGEYREQLEAASRSIGTHESFSDEISLSYLSHLSDSINLLNTSTEKAAICQNQFDDTFNLLMKRISILRNEKKNVMSQCEKLLVQLNESTNIVNEEMSDKISFLEEQLRKERLLTIKHEKEIEKLKNVLQDAEKYCKCCLYSRKSGLENDFTVEMCARSLGLEALDLANDSQILDHEHYVVQRSFSFSDIYTKPVPYDDCVHISIQTETSTSSVEDLSKLDIETDLKSSIFHLSSDKDSNTELEMCRNYNMSIDNLSNKPRYKINKSLTYDIDIEGIIENSWLGPSSRLEERRASVFVQQDNEQNQFKDVEDKSVSRVLATTEIKHGSVHRRKNSSSCSSSNDTSDAVSVDYNEERKKLAQQLENRSRNLRSRSPALTLLNNSLGVEDLKSITPTMVDNEQSLPLEEHIQISEIQVMNEIPKSEDEQSINQLASSENVDVTETENVKVEALKERKQSIIPTISVETHIDDDQVDSSYNCNFGTYHLTDMKSELSPVSIMEPPVKDSVNESNDESVVSNTVENVEFTKEARKMSIIQSSAVSDVEMLTIQASMDKNNLSSRSSSITGEETINSSISKLRTKRLIRPHTIAGIGLNSFKSLQDDIINNYDEHSTNKDISDIQEAIDVLNETSRSLIEISSEDLESKYSEAMLMYRTDRPTIITRGIDANNKCNRALTNVEQEFNILRHLIKNLSQTVEPPSDLLIRIKTSINVLEKCVEYLSSKSEILGSVQQELRLSCLADLMQSYTTALQKQKESHLRELEELRNSLGILNEIGMNNTGEQSRPKRSILAGKKLLSKVKHSYRYSLNSISLYKASDKKQMKNMSHEFRRRSKSDTNLLIRNHQDAKTRFQIVAQNTATKTSILRHFSNAVNKVGDISASPDTSQESSKYDTKVTSSRSSSNPLGFMDIAKKVMEDENFKSHKLSSSKFFPSTPNLEDCMENLFQKGLAQGLRMNTDQVLTDLRAQQSKFSSTLDSLSDMIEESELNNDSSFGSNHSSGDRFSSFKNKIMQFISSLRFAFTKALFVAFGVFVMVGLILPWVFIPADSDNSNFTSKLSRRRSYSFPDRSDKVDKMESSTSSIFSSNINVIRHNPPAV